MDLFSHALLGFILGQASQLDTNAQIILIISSVILDIDAVSIPGWRESFRTHQGPLHSIFSALLISFTISTIYAVLMRLPAEVFIAIVLVCLVGSLSHIFLDLLTAGNIAVLWPFSSERVAFDLTHFVDPIFFGVVSLTSVFIIYVKNNVIMIHIATIVAVLLITVSFGVRYYERDAAVETIRGLNLDAASKVMPLPTFRPDKWWIVVKAPFEKGYRYEIYSVDSIGKKILCHSSVESPFVDCSDQTEPPIDSPQKAVAYSKRDDMVNAFLRKSRLPAVNVTLSDDGKTWHVFWYDISTRLTQLSERVFSGVIVKTDFNGMVTVNFLTHERA